MVKTLPIVALMLLPIVAWVLPAEPVQASEGELEWESVPRPGIILVRYNEGTDTETGRIHQNLRVRIVDGRKHSAYEVFVKGRRVGELVTDGEGDAELVIDRNLRSRGDGRPPAHRRIDTGDRCEVRDGELILWDEFARIP